MQMHAICRVSRALRHRDIGTVLLVASTLTTFAARSVQAQAPLAHGHQAPNAADSMRAVLRRRALEANGAVTVAALTKTVRPEPKPAHAAPSHAIAKPTVRKTSAVPKVVAATPTTVPAAVSAPASISSTIAPAVVPASTPATTSAPAPEPTPSPEVAPAPTPTPSVAPTPAPTTAAPRIAEVGFGSLRFDGLLQLWFAASDTRTANTFRIRRAELKVSGKVSPKVSWVMMFDMSKALSLNSSTSTVNGSKVLTDATVNQGTRLMQDALLTLDIVPALHVDAGQFRLPIGDVGSSSSSQLETIERPMFQSDRARSGALGDVRDIGMVVRGSAKRGVDYWIGAFNGSGESMNSVDGNNQKSLVGRVTFRTPIAGLRVGASGLSSGFASGMAARRDRLGGEAMYTHDAYLLRAELQRGIDGSTVRSGGYMLLGIRPSKGVQVVGRLDTWDPDVRREDDAATSRATDVMGGATWFLAGDNAKLQINLSHRWFANNAAPAFNQLLFNLQASW